MRGRETTAEDEQTKPAGGLEGGVAKTGVSSRCRKTGWWRVWRLVKNRIFLDTMSHCSQSIQIAYLCCVLIILFNFVLFLSIFTFILNTLFNKLLEKNLSLTTSSLYSKILLNPVVVAETTQCPHRPPGTRRQIMCALLRSHHR